MKPKGRGDLNGFLDAGSHIRGELHFEDTFRIDGKLTGKAVSEGELVVGERGSVEAEIEVGSLFVSGAVTGSVTATRRIEIAAGSRVRADLETPVLVVEDGAVVEGYCQMTGRGGQTQGASTVTPLARRRDGKHRTG